MAHPIAKAPDIWLAAVSLTLAAGAQVSDAAAQLYWLRGLWEHALVSSAMGAASVEIVRALWPLEDNPDAVRARLIKWLAAIVIGTVAGYYFGGILAKETGWYAPGCHFFTGLCGKAIVLALSRFDFMSLVSKLFHGLVDVFLKIVRGKSDGA